MKKEYFKPQLKTCYLEFVPLMDQTSSDVHTDDPQDPGGALSNSGNVWDEEEANDWDDENSYNIFDIE